MILARRHLTVLLNALYETDRRRVTVEHPCSEVGELLRFRLEEPFESPVRFTKSLPAYDDARESVQRQHAPEAYDDLPDDSAYVRSLVAAGVLDIENHDDVDSFVSRNGYRDLEAGHPPAVAGIDANIIPWRMGTYSESTTGVANGTTRVGHRPTATPSHGRQGGTRLALQATPDGFAGGRVRRGVRTPR